MAERTAVIAGAGLAGALLATRLAQRGWGVTLVERRADPRLSNVYEGRSINLALSTRGLTALAQIGVTDAVVRGAVPMSGRRMHAVDGTRTYQPYGRSGQAILSVSRAALNIALLDAAEQAGATVLFDGRVVDVDVDAGAMTAEIAGAAPRPLTGDIVVGADGAFSAVRQRVMRHGRFNYAQTFLTHGYKELTMPPAADGGFRMEADALHIWPRHDYMMIALPNMDRTFTCTLFLAHEGEVSFASLQSRAEIEAFFAETFPDAVALIPDLAGQFVRHPVGDLAYIRCAPYHAGDHVVLVGDAAHAVVPFYGQGMNAAFESCMLLDALLVASRGDTAAALRAYSTQRKPDADAISELALENFVEMRDRVADPAFLRRKQLERVLEWAFPETVRSLYAMVTFSNTPYAESRATALAQTRWLDRVEGEGGAEVAGLLALAWIRALIDA